MGIGLASLDLGPPVFLAPLAGITDLPFRRLVARFGAGLVVSEMVASGELLTARPSVRAKARTDLGLDDGVPTSVQLAGREAGAMADAARMVADMGAAIIDISMGCPAKKVTGGLSGSALMRDLDHALTLIDAVVGAVDLPVTLKCRLGWDQDCLNAATLARRAEAAGVRMITVHGRTRAQFYDGQADWMAIRSVVDAVRIPVIANGDIHDAVTARLARRLSGAAGVMVGRAARGAPWRLDEISRGQTSEGQQGPCRKIDVYDVVSEHYEDILRFYGVDLGLRNARKHLGWYADEAGVAPALRAALLRAPSPSDTRAVIAEAFSGRDARRAA